MTQQDSIILPIIHTWARILWQPGYDYDELVAIGYCAAKPLPNTKTQGQVASWVKWMISRFMFGDTEHKGCHDNLKDLSDIFAHKELLSYPPDDAIIDIQDAIRDLSCLESQLIYMRFWRGQTLEEIAQHFNKSFSWARDNCERVLGILRNRLLE